MNIRILSTEQITAYDTYLRIEERAAGTREKYLRDVQAFVCWLNGAAVTKEAVTSWKERLLAEHRAPSTVNAALSALEAICSTGVRVSEIRYLTVEAVQRGRAEISLKGKVRTILIPTKLARKLLKYAKKNKTVSGEIFLTGNGKSLSRRQIWAEMKRLCVHAGVEPSKVFPHNLRHCFATAYYRAYRDIAKLADVLGHSSIETTRIYLLTSGAEHQRQLDRLGLVS